MNFAVAWKTATEDCRKILYEHVLLDKTVRLVSQAAFPLDFAIDLPADLPSSMVIRDDGWSAGIEYRLLATWEDATDGSRHCDTVTIPVTSASSVLCRQQQGQHVG